MSRHLEQCFESIATVEAGDKDTSCRCRSWSLEGDV